MALRLMEVTSAMLGDMLEVDIAAWGVTKAASRDMLAARLERNPGGCFAAFNEDKGKFAGSVWTNRVADQPYRTWQEASGAGFYHNFIPDGPVLYGVNISVDWRNVSFQAVGPFLLSGALEHARKSGCTYARTGARMPGFRRWRPLFRSAEDYICLFRDGNRLFYRDPAYGILRECPTSYMDMMARRSVPNAEPVEPTEWPFCENRPEKIIPIDFELVFFCGEVVTGRSLEIVRLLPDYYPDLESGDCGVLLEWRNPDLVP